MVAWGKRKGEEKGKRREWVGEEKKCKKGRGRKEKIKKRKVE